MMDEKQMVRLEQGRLEPFVESHGELSLRPGDYRKGLQRHLIDLGPEVDTIIFKYKINWKHNLIQYSY